MMHEKEDAILLKLYKESFPDAARLLKKMGGNLEECKDVFHDALIIYLEKRMKGKLTIHSSAKAYLIGITKILWLQRQRQGYNSVSLEELNFEVPAAEEWRPNEKEKGMLEWLEMAGQKCLQLLKAFYYDGHSMQEVARHFGLKGSRSATVQKYKCLEKLRTEVKKRELYEERVN